jgi:hypothetical protein
MKLWESNEGAAAPSFGIVSSGSAGGAGRLRSKLSLHDSLPVMQGEGIYPRTWSFKMEKPFENGTPAK